MFLGDPEPAPGPPADPDERRDWLRRGLERMWTTCRTEPIEYILTPAQHARAEARAQLMTEEGLPQSDINAALMRLIWTGR